MPRGRVMERPPFECIALLLQGGGALGAYQAGAYEALAEAGLQPDWVAGISIGAINSALIAGNPPQERVARLRQFWESVTANEALRLAAALGSWYLKGDQPREYYNQSSAALAMSAGVPGFFLPRSIPPYLCPDGSLEATSWYDTAPLRQQLERLVDFDRINGGAMRLSVGAVNVTSGNFVYFDRNTRRIGPEHIMASSAFPPAFPAVKIEGEHYWDGGLVSNTPLQWVLQNGPRQDTLAFQVDLWSARGNFPGNLSEVETRRKEIGFSSRTRDNTDQFRKLQQLRCLTASLLEKLPEAERNTPAMRALAQFADHKVYRVVHLIYHAQLYEGDSKDYEFSRRSMEEHWRAGYDDTVRSLRHPEALTRPPAGEGAATFDVATAGGD